MNKKTVKDVDVRGKKVLVRCDFNVPMKDGAITDENRIIGALPTIKYLMEHGAKVILCSHMGKPHNVFDAKVELNKKEKAKIAALPEAEQAAATAEALEKAKKDVKKLTLAPVAARLNELLGGKVTFASDVIGDDAKKKVADCRDGECVLLENLRFHKGEEKKEPDFMKALASYCDVYVNDAFGAAHRAHASITGVAKYIPAVCGFLIEKELTVMGGAMAAPEHPFIAIMGGSKVADKLGLIGSFIGKCDAILVVGGMAYTFFKANGGSIGSSICDDKSLDLVSDLIAEAESKGTKIYLPVDTVIADQFSNDSNFRVVEAGCIPEASMGMDIGPRTVENYTKVIKGAKTIVWNGPAGVFEMSNFAAGTEGIARAVAESGAVSIIGGGDSAAAIEKLGLQDKVTHVSTGGGAAIEFLEGRELPGIACLLDK